MPTQLELKDMDHPALNNRIRFYGYDGTIEDYVVGLRISKGRMDAIIRLGAGYFESNRNKRGELIRTRAGKRLRFSIKVAGHDERGIMLIGDLNDYKGDYLSSGLGRLVEDTETREYTFDLFYTTTLELWTYLVKD